MIEINFILDQPTILLNEWQRMEHWAQKKHMEELSWRVLTVARDQRPLHPLPFSTIYIERHSPNLPDWDGLYGGMKPLLDVLTSIGRKNTKGSRNQPFGLGFIADDNPRSLLDLTCRPRLCKRGASHTRVRILEATPH